MADESKAIENLPADVKQQAYLDAMGARNSMDQVGSAAPGNQPGLNQSLVPEDSSKVIDWRDQKGFEDKQEQTRQASQEMTAPGD